MIKSRHLKTPYERGVIHAALSFSRPLLASAVRCDSCKTCFTICSITVYFFSFFLRNSFFFGKEKKRLLVVIYTCM